MRGDDPNDVMHTLLAPDDVGGLHYIAGFLEGYFVYKRDISVLRHPWKWNDPLVPMRIGREIIARSASVYDRRKPWKRHSLENIQWCVDAWIEIAGIEKPVFKDIRVEVTNITTTYLRAMYRMDGPLQAEKQIVWISIYDRLYLGRKDWRKKSIWHGKHLYNQGGWNAVGL